MILDGLDPAPIADQMREHPESWLTVRAAIRLIQEKQGCDKARALELLEQFKQEVPGGCIKLRPS